MRLVDDKELRAAAQQALDLGGIARPLGLEALRGEVKEEKSALVEQLTPSRFASRHQHRGCWRTEAALTAKFVPLDL